MNIKKTLTASLLALSIGNAFAAGSEGVEHNTQAFLNALAAGGGKPLSQIPEVKAALVRQAAAELKTHLN